MNTQEVIDGLRRISNSKKITCPRDFKLITEALTLLDVCETATAGLIQNETNQPAVLLFAEVMNQIHIDGWNYIELHDEFEEELFCLRCIDITINGDICYEFDTPYNFVACDQSHYRKTWRCWSDLPTKEQRKAVPWE